MRWKRLAIGLERAVLHRSSPLIVASLLLGGIPGVVRAQVPVDQLVFKGTHNSYACRTECGPVSCTQDPPIMNHPLNQQIDEFGVWAIELDFGVIRENGVPVPVVGHDGPGDAVTCYGPQFPGWPRSAYLTDFLSAVRNSSALRYRPVLIYFEVKEDWGDHTLDYQSKLSLGIRALSQSFQGNFLVLEEYLSNHNGQYPTVTETRGKAILYFPSPEFPRDNHPNDPRGTLRGTSADLCTSPRAIDNAIGTGEICGSAGCRVPRLDQYQGDWTFEYGVPPNPLVVDSAAPSAWTVTDSRGDDWSCPTELPGESPNCTLFGILATCDLSRGQIVHSQGTYRFPYRTVQGAITRARGIVPSRRSETREFRSGLGWTVLIKPGTYPEALRIDLPLAFRKFDDLPGLVVIGR
jgi:hypothetical protein